MKVYLLLMLIAMGVTVLMTPLVRWSCIRWGIVPKLRSRDIQKQPVPRLGGIAMTIGLVVALLVASRIPYMAPLYTTSVPWAVIGAATTMTVLGLVDDLVELDWMTKLSGQVLIAGAMAFAGVQLISFPLFGVTIGSSRLSLIVTVVLVVGIVNAVNFIDGLDGLAAGTIAIGAGAFFVYSYLLSRIMGATSYATTASLVVIALLGVCLGFLWFNFHPSSIMMGGGAETLGLVLASASIIVTGQIDPSVLGTQQLFVGILPILLPLAVIFIPVLNLIVASIRRIARGTSPFHADRTSHFHDRLIARGHSHRGVVAIMWMWTAIVCVPSVALLIFDWWKIALSTLPVFVIALVATVRQFPTSHYRSREDEEKINVEL